MKLSAPVHELKSRAKEIKSSRKITMIEALDQVARSEGFSSWSLLQSRVNESQPRSRKDVLGYLNPGDLMLIGARPGLGKTRFALEILAQALGEGRRGYFFSLEYSASEMESRIANIRKEMAVAEIAGDYFSVDLSDDISASYIMETTKETISSGSVIVVDYLQLLDQKRSNPEVKVQVETLKAYAKDKKCIIVFISQLDRRYDAEGETLPQVKDVRMPNEFDVDLMNKLLLFHQGKQFCVKPAVFELGA